MTLLKGVNVGLVFCLLAVGKTLYGLGLDDTEATAPRHLGVNHRIGSLEQTATRCRAARPMSTILIQPAPALVRFAPHCDDCPTPDVMILDFDAGRLPASDHGITQEQIDFTDLYFAAGGFFAEAFGNDPRHDCMRYFDNHFQPASRTVRDTVPTDPIQPPVGPVAGTDYVVGGKIVGARGNYSLTVSLEDATTREQVATSSVQFANAADALDAGKRAEQAMAPLFDKIRAYQKRKRDQSDEFAIAAHIRIKKARDRMNVREQQSIEVFAYDCDGEDHPLKNRKIKLRSDSGTFSPEDVTTGPDGKARATFTATSSGLGQITATYFPYTTVTHKQNGAHDATTVQIGDPPSGIWQVEVTATENTFDDNVSDVTDGETHRQTDDHRSVMRHANVVFWIKNTFEADQIRGRDVVNVSGVGGFDYYNILFHKTTSPKCSYRIKDLERGDGLFIREDSNINFTIYPDKAELAGAVHLKGTASDDQWSFDSCSLPHSSHSHNDQSEVNYDIEIGDGSDDLSLPQTAETRRTGVFTFSLDKDFTETNPNGGVLRKQRRGTIVLKPLTVSQWYPGRRN